MNGCCEQTGVVDGDYLKADEMLNEGVSSLIQQASEELRDDVGCKLY